MGQKVFYKIKNFLWGCLFVSFYILYFLSVGFFFDFLLFFIVTQIPRLFLILLFVHIIELLVIFHFYLVYSGVIELNKELEKFLQEDPQGYVNFKADVRAFFSEVKKVFCSFLSLLFFFIFYFSFCKFCLWLIISLTVPFKNSILFPYLVCLTTIIIFLDIFFAFIKRERQILLQTDPEGYYLTISILKYRFLYGFLYNFKEIIAILCFVILCASFLSFLFWLLSMVKFFIIILFY